MPQHKITLLCATKKPHDQGVVFLEGGKYKRNSWLDLQVEKLPKLQREEVEMELQRYELDLSPDEFAQVVNAIHVQTGRAYALLQIWGRRLKFREDADLPLSQRFSKWGMEAMGEKVRSSLTARSIDKTARAWEAWLAVVIAVINRLSGKLLIVGGLLKKGWDWVQNRFFGNKP